jgi:hypothetical protein
MDQTAVDLQKKIVGALARSIDGAWERIVVNYEMQEEDGGLTEDRRGFYITPDAAGGYRKAGLTFDAAVKDLFHALRETMQRSEGQGQHKGWGICDLVVDQPGRFRFNFSYDSPKRINGVFDDESMGRFDRYLDTYKAERAGA